MPAPLYESSTEGAVALSAATAKSIIGAKGHANSGLLLSFAQIGFDGVTASAVPVLIELCSCSWATNSPGTNSTSTTPRQKSGRVMTAQYTAGKTWTTEPTALTVIRDWILTPNGGLLWYDLPLGKEWDFDVATGPVIRVTAPATVNVRSTMELSRC